MWGDLLDITFDPSLFDPSWIDFDTTGLFGDLGFGADFGNDGPDLSAGADFGNEPPMVGADPSAFDPTSQGTDLFGGPSAGAQTPGGIDWMKLLQQGGQGLSALGRLLQQGGGGQQNRLIPVGGPGGGVPDVPMPNIGMPSPMGAPGMTGLPDPIEFGFGGGGLDLPQLMDIPDGPAIGPVPIPQAAPLPTGPQVPDIPAFTPSALRRLLMER